MTPAVWIDVDRAVEAGEQRRQPVGPADVADDRLDPGESRERRQVLAVGAPGPAPSRGGCRARPPGRGGRPARRPSQPAGARDDRDVGSVEPRLARRHRPAWCAFDEPAGVADGDRHHRRLRVDAGGVREQRGVVDADVGGAPHQAEAVGGRAERPRRTAPSSTGARSSRWPGTTLNVACIVARSAGRRTTGAPRYDGYTVVAPASSMSRASRARPRPSRARSRRVRRYVTTGSRRPGQRPDPAPALAGDRRVVHGERAPLLDGRAEPLPLVAEGQRHQARRRCRSAEGQVGGELLHLVHRHVVGRR